MKLFRDDASNKDSRQEQQSSGTEILKLKQIRGMFFKKPTSVLVFMVQLVRADVSTVALEMVCRNQPISFVSVRAVVLDDVDASFKKKGPSKRPRTEELATEPPEKPIYSSQYLRTLDGSVLEKPPVVCE